MSSLFFDYPCKGEGIHGGSPTDLAWCKSENILACAWDSGTIAFFDDEGAEVGTASIKRDSQRPTTMDWFPKGKTIGVGWSDGQVSVWNVMEPLPESPSVCTCANFSVHRLPVTFLLWNPAGTRLVTGDKAGITCVWKVDGRGNITPSVQYRKNSSVTAAVFCTGPENTSDILSQQAFSPSFFFSTEAGLVCYADDLGHCTDVQQLTSSVDRLVFYEEEKRLVIITRSLLMTQLQVGEDGSFSQFMKVKLSVSASSLQETGLREVTWAGPGLLAAATGEALVRFWDLSSDENYVLLLTAAGLERGDRAVSIGFNPLQRYLAVGTKHGCVAIWRFVGEYCSQVSHRGEKGGRGGETGNRSRRPVRTRWSPTPGARLDLLTHKANSNGPGDWEALSPTTLGSSPTRLLRWGPTGGLLGVLAGLPGIGNGGGGANILAETVLHRQLSGNVAVIQLASNTLSVEYQEEEAVSTRRGAGIGSEDDGGLSGAHIVKCDIGVKGFDVEGNVLVVYNGKEAQTLRLQGPGLAPKRGELWACRGSSMAVDASRDQIFLAADSRIEIYNLQGGFKSAVTFSEGEGSPVVLSLCGSNLAVATDKGVIKLFDVSKRSKVDNSTLPVRPMGSAGKFVCPTSGKLLGLVRSIKCNADGTRVSILSDRVRGQALKIRAPDSHLHVYDADRDVVTSFDYAPFGRCPTAHFWDPEEPRLLAVEARRVRGGGNDVKGGDSSSRASQDKGERKEGIGQERGSEGSKESGVTTQSLSKLKANMGPHVSLEDAGICDAEVTTLFVTADFGILMQDSFPLEPPLEGLLGLKAILTLWICHLFQVPRLHFTARCSEEKPGQQRVGQEKGPLIMSRVMRDFVGLDEVDSKTTAALLDFSFHLTVGDMDKAYEAVRLIRSTTVWENMAHMCVKTKRLDVAEVCLGNMGHARGAAAVRLAKKEPEPEVAVAEVAIQLGLLDDAARLYRECERYDLLNRLYQAAGLWERALEVAKEKDTINLSTTYQLYAKHLEKVGDLKGAIRHYELASTSNKEVPRMLFERNRFENLEDYISHASNPELLVWWAQYLESLGDCSRATDYYSQAHDFLSLVRLACQAGDIQKAVEIVEESGSAPAAYHLARHLEAVGETTEAVRYYAHSCRYNHAIRLARDHGMDSELMGFALKSRPSLMLSVAAHFEERGQLERAIQLYQKGGDVPRALDVCFKAGAEGRPAMFDVLKSITEDLGSDASPQVLSKCADFFIEHNQFEKAVGLCIKGKRYLHAINLCIDHKVTITEDMAEQLTPPKDVWEEGAGGTSNKRRNSANYDSKSTNSGGEGREDVLVELAKACKRQSNFHLACKKYTQAGERLKAMKCLLKSGDTKSIMYYAGVSRSREIYILGANYLQNLDWHDDPQVMKAIISFYTKAKAYIQLSDFFDACAQVEIDEYRDYEKAMEALNEAIKNISKAGPSADRLAQLQKRVYMVESFVQARRLTKDDPQAMVKLCMQLLDRSDLETAIRAGDCFATLVEHFYSLQDWKQCYSLLVRMRERGIVLDPYLDREVVSRVCEEIGIAVEELDPSMGEHGRTQGDDDDDEVGEDLPMEEGVDSDNDTGDQEYYK
ncbi:unnamed protein product [Discosporangium mesarthrocarpum]